MPTDRRILVTGAEGFLGRRLVAALRAEGVPVIATDLLASDASEEAFVSLAADILAPGGLRAIDAVLAEEPGDGLRVAHLAGLSHASSAEKDPPRAYSLNVRAVDQVWTLAAAHGARRFVFPSTALVYGCRSEVTALDEDTAPRPSGTYATTKLEAERYLLADRQADLLPPVVLRLANVYGAGMQADTLVGTVLRGLRAGQLQVRGPDTVRDYVHASDVVRAFVLALLDDAPGRLYNVGTGEGSSVSDVVRTASDLLGIEQEPPEIPPPPPDERALVLSHARITADLGWEPAFSLREGLAEIIANEQ